MSRQVRALGAIIAGTAFFVALAPHAFARDDAPLKRLSGSAAFGDWKQDAPGIRRRITAADLPAPLATPSVGNSPRVVVGKKGALPKVPPGFDVMPLATGLEGPRLLRVAPNGDIFVAETAANRVRVLRAGPDGALQAKETYAEGLSVPFGIAFYPPGPDPQWIYIGNTDSVVRFPYRNGDLTPRGERETIVSGLPTGGHFTRDVAFSLDGEHMYVSVGSLSNVGEGMEAKTDELAAAWDAEKHAIGAAWGGEEGRADVLEFTPEGKDRRIYATGIRNCVGLAVHPRTADIWCSTNERDGLGDNLAPDYVTRLRAGGFYGWPWYYIGSNPDPRLKGQRLDLKGKAIVPDTLLQPHSAPLQMTFYDGSQFPEQYQGDGFAALHGSWNRAKPTGYKVVRIVLKNGTPTGEYEDFLTGFGVDDKHVWGRPVGVAVAKDGSLLVSEDGNGTVWRISYTGSAAR